MLSLTPEQKARIVAQLNTKEAQESLKNVGRAPANTRGGQFYSSREEWEENEDEPYDTTSSPFRAEALHWANEIIKDTKRHIGPGKEYNAFHPYIRATDFYYYSGRNKKVEGRERIVPKTTAFLVLDTVFFAQAESGTWTHRQWLGCQDDPLLRLPYSRKYDYERAERTEFMRMNTTEALMRQMDLLSLIRQRVAKVVITNPFERFAWPDTSDIREQMHKDSFDISTNTMYLQAVGACSISLIRVKQNLNKSGNRGDWEAVYPEVAQSEDQSMLREMNYPNAATLKLCLLENIESLIENVMEICHCEEEESAFD